METIICDISAFLFWRTPPILRLLAAAPEDDPCLSRLIGRDELLSLRAEMAERIPLCKKSLENGTMWRGSAEAARSIRDASMYLAPSLDFPVDVLVAERRHQHISSSTKTRLWTGGVPLGHKASISDELWVTSPAFTLQQLAARATLGRTVLLAAELCGSFSVYETPEPFKSLLECWAAAGGIPSYGGWSPCFDAKGNLTDLWTHGPLTTPNELLELAQKSESRRGRARLAAAAELVTAGAASPFEAKIGTLLGLPRRLGGEGYGGFVHNKKDSASGLRAGACSAGLLLRRPRLGGRARPRVPERRVSRQQPELPLGCGQDGRSRVPRYEGSARHVRANQMPDSPRGAFADDCAASRDLVSG